MILYYAPGACSLADHIALHEAGLSFTRVKVDLQAHRAEDGRDFGTINPKGYVPALELNSGEVLTENIAILSWVSDQALALTPEGPLGKYRLLEMLAFISTEIHKGFKPFFSPNSTEADKAQAGQTLVKRLTYLAERLKGPFLIGDRFSVADAYLFVMLSWARKNGVPLPEPLPAYFGRMAERPGVKLAMQHEGLIPAEGELAPA
jgi:glutathione S-transferase